MEYLILIRKLKFFVCWLVFDNLVVLEKVRLWIFILLWDFMLFKRDFEECDRLGVWNVSCKDMYFVFIRVV